MEVVLDSGGSRWGGGGRCGVVADMEVVLGSGDGNSGSVSLIIIYS